MSKMTVKDLKEYILKIDSKYDDLPVRIDIDDETICEAIDEYCVIDENGKEESFTSTSDIDFSIRENFLTLDSWFSIVFLDKTKSR